MAMTLTAKDWYPFPTGDPEPYGLTTVFTVALQLDPLASPVLAFLQASYDALDTRRWTHKEGHAVITEIHRQPQEARSNMETIFFQEKPQL